MNLFKYHEGFNKVANSVNRKFPNVHYFLVGAVIEAECLPAFQLILN